MCATCGCQIPEDKHGDPRNLTWSEITASAEASGVSVDQAIRNIDEMAVQQGQR